jgi:HK97 family phage major capsid protein
VDIRAILADLAREDETANTRLRELIEAAEGTETRSLDESATAEFDRLTGEIEARAERRSRLEAQLAREDEAAKRAADLAASTRAYGTAAKVTREEGPYTPDSSRNGGPSFFRDLARVRRGDMGAAERLQRNNAHAQAYSQRAISTANGAGGEFVPPLWLEQDFVPLARPGRVTADLMTKDALPAGTDSINIPKVNTGTAVALQGTPTGGQNAAVLQTDLTTTSVSSGVYTVAGGQTVSMQLLEQSPVNIDRVVFQDLAKAYAIQVDNFVIAGTGSNQPQGLLTLSGKQTDQAAATTSTPAQVFKLIANQISAIQTSRYEAPTHILMHPRRWYWFVSAVDSSGRPFVVPRAQGPFNALADGSNQNNTQGIVGEMLGLPVVVDPNLPTNLPDAQGTPANDADNIVVAKFDDCWLWESAIKAEAFEQTYAQNLSLFLRLYGYMSFQPSRYPLSVGLVTKLSNLS